MKWNINWLKQQPNQGYEIKENLKFDSTMFKNVSNIVDVEPILITGRIWYDNNTQVNGDLLLEGTLILPCCLSGEAGKLAFSFTIKGIISELYPEVISATEINLYELVWQKLIVEAPTRFVKKENDLKEGKAWKLLSEDEYTQYIDDKVDPRFAKLLDLVIDEKEE